MAGPVVPLQVFPPSTTRRGGRTATLSRLFTDSIQRPVPVDGSSGSDGGGGGGGGGSGGSGATRTRHNTTATTTTNSNTTTTTTIINITTASVAFVKRGCLQSYRPRPRHAPVPTGHAPTADSSTPAIASALVLAPAVESTVSAA